MASIPQIGFNLLLLFAFTSLASSTLCDLTVQDCGSTNGKLYSLSINETCTKRGSAELKRGQPVMINFTFSANADEDQLHSKVWGELTSLPIFVPFPLKNDDACKNSGLQCPVKAGTKHHFVNSLDILSSFPPVKVIVKWELLNSKNEKVFCALVPAKLVD